MVNEFHAEVNYTSDLQGFLGASELDFIFDAGPGGSPFFIATGPTLTVPALDPFDTLTLSGFFLLESDGFTGGSTEIEVFGAPEPSAALLMLAGVAGLVGIRRR